MTPNELVLTFRGSYVCANFCENRSRNATVRVLADGQTHTHTDTHTDANRFYNLSHAICYSYGTDNKSITHVYIAKCRCCSERHSSSSCACRVRSFVDVGESMNKHSRARSRVDISVATDQQDSAQTLITAQCGLAAISPGHSLDGADVRQVPVTSRRRHGLSVRDK